MIDRVLEIDGLTKLYGSNRALSDLSFEARPGELFGFVGRNGAGKTTTMRIILGVLVADGGEVRWGGRPLTFESRRRIGYLPEERGLYPRMRVLEQLVYLAELHGMTSGGAHRAARAWLDRFGLGERVNDEVQRLSLGNQQRVQLAAALIFSPDILILDEPFSGLDPVAVDLMSAVLREQAAAGLPVLFSSHELNLVEQLCDRVGIIDRGSMVACGTVEELGRGGPRRVFVDVPGALEGWAARLPGVTPVRSEGTRQLLELAPDCSPQVILQAALRAGPVREFSPAQSSLGDLFRDVVYEGRT
jgi:ABC-2 type transport system ATP-binding protein